MVEVLRTTTSICPECMEPIKADIYVDDEKNWVMMRKNCKKHGDFLDKISINPEQYKWQNGYVDSLGSRMDTAPINIENKETKKGCPYDCGLCKDHKSATCMMILDITNRCNLNCPICFANANRQGRIVEYSYDEVVHIMEHFVRQRPNFAAIAQFSGGEPTLHPRIIDLLKKAKELGFPHRMLNTNGIRMAKDIEFCKQVKEADCGAIYLSFDGLEPETHKKIRGMDLTKIKQKFIENCRTVGIDGIMLVITLAKGINDHEVPAILNYVKENNDVIAGVVFQPVSLCGRIGLEDLMNLRYTNSDLLPEIRKATNDGIKEFYPLGMHNKLTSLITWFGDQPMWAVSAHDDCGFATLAQVTPDGTWHGIEEYMEIEGLVKWANQVWDMVCKREIPKPSKLIESVKAPLLRLGFEPLLDALGSFTDKMTDFAYRQAMKAYFVAGAAKYFKKEHLKDVMSDRFYKNIFQLLLDPTLRSSKGMLLNGLIFIGSMHFQDAYNMDVARVQRCVVHYGVLNPDDPQDVLQIPFCTFNTIHRERIEKQWALNHSSPLDKSPEQHAKEVQALEDSIAAEKRAK